MDQDIKAFRAAAARANGGRKGLQRRYSVTLRAQAVRCWEVRQRAGKALRDVAVALGVTAWLSQWDYYVFDPKDGAVKETTPPTQANLVYGNHQFRIEFKTAGSGEAETFARRTNAESICLAGHAAESKISYLYFDRGFAITVA